MIDKIEHYDEHADDEIDMLDDRSGVISARTVLLPSTIRPDENTTILLIQIPPHKMTLHRFLTAQMTTCR